MGFRQAVYLCVCIVWAYAAVVVGPLLLTNFVSSAQVGVESGGELQLRWAQPMPVASCIAQCAAAGPERPHA